MFEQVIGWVCIALIAFCGVNVTFAYREEPDRQRKTLLGASLVCLGCLFVGIAVMMNV